MAVRIAKLLRPRATRVHPRPALFRRLRQATGRGGAWLVGSPGSGKTTLAASWLEAERQPTLWYQLDGGDSDAATFFHFLGLGARPLCRASALPRFSPEALEAPHLFARRWFRAFGQAVRGRAVVVLDDYQEIHPDSPLHAALAQGFAELPDHVAALVLSREEPPAAFARLRAAERLVVLTGETLALSIAEARAIARLRRAGAGVLRRVPELHARSGGWATGFVLLLDADADADASAGPGDLVPRLLPGYFEQEALAGAAPEDRRGLSICALVSRITGACAARLTGSEEVPAMLESLARRSFFTTRDAGAPPAYRFHDLFRDFLRARAEAELTPPELAARRSTAAGLLALEGRTEEAVELALEAGDAAQARRHVLALAPSMLAGGRLATLLDWLGRLPPDLRDRDPALLYWLGAASSPFAPAAALTALERSFELHRAAGSGRGAWLAWAALVETHAWGLVDVAPLDRLLALLGALEQAWPLDGDPELDARVTSAAVVGYMHRAPAHPDFAGWAARALALARSSLDPALRVRVALPLLTYFGWWAADLDRGAAIAGALEPFVARPQADPVLAILWHAAVADMHLHAGRVEAGRRMAERGLAASRASGLRRWDPMLLMCRALADIFSEDRTATEVVLAELGAATVEGPPLHRCIYHQMAGIAALVQGRPAEAADQGDAAMRHAAGLPFAENACRLTMALGRSRRRAGGDLPALREVVAAARRSAHAHGQAMGALALASEALRMGERTAALDALRDGLAVCRRIGYRIHPWLRPAELSALCALALEHGVEAPFVQVVVTANGLAPGGSAVFLEAWPRPLRLTALGGLAVERGEKPVATAGGAHRRALTLLRLLVAHGPRGARLETLCDALWPDSEGDAARSALDTLAWRLRKLLGEPGAVVQRAGRLLLDPAVVFVDAWAAGKLAEDLVASAGAGSEAPAGAAAAAGPGLDAEALLAERRLRLRRLGAAELLPGDDEPEVVAARVKLRGGIEKALAV